MKARREHPRPKTPGWNDLPKMLKKNMRFEQKISEKWVIWELRFLKELVKTAQKAFFDSVGP